MVRPFLWWFGCVSTLQGILKYVISLGYFYSLTLNWEFLGIAVNTLPQCPDPWWSILKWDFERDLFVPFSQIHEIAFSYSGNPQKTKVLLMTIKSSMTRARERADGPAFVCSHSALLETIMTPSCPGLFLNFNLWNTFSLYDVKLSSCTVLEFQRICEICVFKIDFLIFTFIPSCLLFSSAISMSLNGPCNVQL